MWRVGLNFVKNRSIQKRFYSPILFENAKNSPQRSLTITDSAAEQLQVLKQKFPEKVLRVSVEPGGCHGFQYKFELEPEVKPESPEL